MSIMPRMSLVGSLINMELCQWDVTEHYIQRSNPKLIGKVYDTIEELIAEVPKDEKHNFDIKLSKAVEGDSYRKGFKVYNGQFWSGEYPVAYGCNECNKIILGAPAIVEIKGGVHGVRYTCNNCQNCMYENIMGHGGCFGGDDEDDDDF